MLKKLILVAGLLAPLTAQASYTMDLGQGQKLTFHKPYMKAYGGYGIEDDINATIIDGGNTYTMKKNGKGAMGSIGVGTHVNKHWRVEAEFYANNGMTAKRGGTPHIEATHYTKALLADVYYDFDEIYPKYRPYVLGGVGAAWSKMRAEYLTQTQKLDDGSDFIWQLGAGVNRNFGTFDIDVGYRMLHLGHNRYGFDFTPAPQEETFIACIIHAGIIGVNFRF